MLFIYQVGSPSPSLFYSRRLHTYNRVCKGQERLPSLIGTNGHLHYQVQIHFEEVVNLYATKYPRRLKLATIHEFREGGIYRPSSDDLPCTFPSQFLWIATVVLNKPLRQSIQFISIVWSTLALDAPPPNKKSWLWACAGILYSWCFVSLATAWTKYKATLYFRQ